MPSNRGRTYAVRLQVDGAGRATADLTGIGRAGDRAFVRIERSASTARQQMQRLLHLGGQVRAGLGALAGAAAIAGTVRLTTAALESVNALADQADAIGLNVERLQEYRIAASAVGVEQEKTDQNLQRFIRRWGQAADGTGTLATMLRRLGIEVRDSEGRVRDAEDGLADIADAMAAAESDSQRLSIAFAAFGLTGARMVNLLGQGSDALQEQLRWARTYGEVLDEDIVRRAQTANTQLGLLRSTVQTAFQAGILDSTLGDLQDFDELLAGSRDTARDWGELVGRGFRTVAEAAQWAADNIELVQAGLGALIGLRIGAAFGPIGAGIGAVAGALLSLTLQAAEYERAQRETNQSMRDASQTATNLRQPLSEVADEYERLNRVQRAEAFAQLAEDLDAQADALRSAADTLGTAIDAAVREIEAAAGPGLEFGLSATARVNPIPDLLGRTPATLSDSLGILRDELTRLESEGGLTTEALDALSQQVLDLAERNPEAADTLRDVQAALARLRPDVEDTTDRIADLERRQALLRGETVDLSDDTDDLAGSLDDAAVAVAGLDGALETLRSRHQATLANLSAQLRALRDGGIAALEAERRLQRQAEQQRQDAQRRFDALREAAEFDDNTPTDVFAAADAGNEAAQEAIRLAEEQIAVRGALSDAEDEARRRAQAREEAARLAWEAELAAMEPVEAQIARIGRQHDELIERLRETGAAAEEIAALEAARNQAIARAREQALARSQAGGAARTERDAVAALIDEIDREREALTQTERQRFVDRFLRRLSTDATAEQVALVRQHAEALWAEVQAQAGAERAERARQRAQADGERLTQRLRTAEERYRDTLDRLNALRQAGTPEETILRASAEARDQFLRDSDDSRAGVVRALEDYSREAGNWAQDLERLTSRAFGRMEDALVAFTTTGAFEWRDMIDAMIADLARLIIRQSITAPLAGAIGGAISGLFGGLFGTPATAAPTGGAGTASGQAVSPSILHRGGIVGVTPAPTRTVPAALFVHAPRLHDGLPALGPREYPAILEYGERVIPAGAGQPFRGDALPTYSILVDARGAADPAEVEAAGYRGAQRALAEQLPGIVKATTQMAHARTVNDWHRRGGRFR